MASNKKLIKNIVYTASSQLLALLISITVTLVVPRLVSVEIYGYWQLYLFYASYVGLAHLGWLDGIYLKYGGFDFDDLDLTLLRGHLFYLFLMQLFAASIVGLYAFLFVDAVQKIMVLMGISVTVVLANIQVYFYYLLQVSNQFDKNAQMSISYSFFYVVALISVSLFGVSNIFLMILADLGGRLLSILLGAYFCRGLFCCSGSPSEPIFQSIGFTIKIGLSLLIANLASSLIVGLFRFQIENFWDISIFAKISLALSLSNFVLVFLNAVGMVLFPLLRRTRPERLKDIYISLRSLLAALVLLGICAYFVAKPLLVYWLPKYELSMYYMGLLFPMMIFEGRVGLLLNPYMKALRKERVLLVCNLFTMALSLVISWIFAALIHDLFLVVVGILLVIAIRCLLIEIYLSGLLGLKIGADIIVEFSLSASFIYCANQLSIFYGGIIYSGLVISVLVWKYREISQAIKILR